MTKFEPFQYEDLSCLESFSPPGWGDLVPRFLHFIESPFCHPVKLLAGNEIAGIGTNILHTDTAWLACIIVHTQHRNKGYGHLLTQYLVDHTREQHIETIYLDATDLGYPVYRKLGFETETEYYHFRPIGSLPNPPASILLSVFKTRYLEQILELDRMVSGEDRQHTLATHMEFSQLFLEDDNLEGFYLPTLDDGLIIAKTERAGVELMRSRLRDKAFATLPADNKTGVSFLYQNNLEQLRISRRMRLGKYRNVQLQNIYNRISGQLG